MPWRKDRPYSTGELEFHLTGLREARGEEVPHAVGHGDEWMKKRAEKLLRRHRPKEM